MTVKYVVISNGIDVNLRRFTSKEGPVERITVGKVLPKPFQGFLHGAGNWEAQAVFHAEDTETLEGIRLLTTGKHERDGVPGILQRVFRVAREARPILR